jgi:LDH2 family malate/lactate/ureidoglycolate dehydrogenase
MANNETRMDAKSLKEFMRQVFTQMGLPPEDAEAGADLLVWCNLRGVDSHGVQRIASFIRSLDDGNLNSNPNIQILKETPAVLFIDADRGLGAVTATFGMKRAMAKAKNVGIGWALITNTTTPLAVGYYTQMAARAGMVGIAATFSRPNMPPYGARAPGLHNGPISIAVPAKAHRPAILDMATSVAAFGKIEVAKDRSVPIPEGWALDADSNPTTDPNQARMVLPFGGYKGSDLAFVFECLTSILAGDPLVGPVLLNREHDRRYRQNSLMAAIDISTFTDVGRFEEHVDDLIDGVKGLPKAEAVDEILVPGEPEDRAYDERIQYGIPLPEGTVRKLRQAAERFGLELPDGL